MRTTAFISLCCKSVACSLLKSVSFRALATSFLGIAVLLAPLLVRAESPIGLRSGALMPSADQTGWVVTADFRVNLSPAVEDAINRGLALNFVAEFQLIRPRWYWADERVVTSRINYRLSYNALTRQYRLSANGFQTNYGSLEEAINVMSRLRGWRVAEADRIRRNETYEVWLRLRLDTSQLPKPFQVGAINNPDWDLGSEWKRIAFLPETPKSAQ